MKLLARGKSKAGELAEERDHILQLELDRASLQAEVAELRELIRHVDADLALLMAAVDRLRPGLPIRNLAESLLDLVFRPFDLASFYVVTVDWDLDLLEFPLYHEGGRIRNHPAIRLSLNPGLTGRTLQARAPLYVRTLEEARNLGAEFTAAELGSGLIPSSWYGVPLGFQEQPLGLVSFMSFQEDAFTESRRRVMDALAAMLGMAMGSSKPPGD